nr:MAG TPA: Replicative helicase [Bacteriophage sp.]
MGLFESALEGIVAIAQARMQQEPGHEDDYIGEDGLLYCGMCKAPRQMVLEVPMVGTRIVPIMCPCEIAKREAEAAREAMEAEQRRIDGMRKIGITSPDYREMVLAADDGSDPKMRAIVDRYIEKRDLMRRENIGLLLHGSAGGGKTFWASALANAMIDHGNSAMITTVPRLVTAMSQDFEAEKSRILEQVERVQFLVLDDVGIERQTGYMAEKMFEIIDARYRSRRPLIVTTNLTLEEISNPQQMEYKRVFDRIVEMCQPIHVSGEGRRKAIAREKSNKAREILGI